MKTYKINITLTDGREVRSSVVARNQSDALARLQSTPQYIDFLAENDAEVASVDIQPVEIRSVDETRFYVTSIKNKEDWYVVADLENRIKVEFKKGAFNDTQKVRPFGGYQPDALKTATALCEIAEYMQKKFKELI